MEFVTNIERTDIEDLRNKFLDSKPFNHLVIDNFLPVDIANKIAEEFPSFDEDIWYSYDNPLEIKKATNNWNNFSNVTYSYFMKVLSNEFTSLLESIIGSKLYPDVGLHGGGLHTHRNGGRLNPHLDYSIHPKLDLQRKLNLILYINPLWKPEYGGNLGLWESNSDGAPGRLVSDVECVFNRAVLFDTTQNSWHGITKEISSPDEVNRNSLAVYYLTNKPDNVDPRMKVKYAPREDQKGDSEIEELIYRRQSMENFKSSYVTNKNKK